MEIKKITFFTKQLGFSPMEHLRIMGPLKKTPIQIMLGFNDDKLNSEIISLSQLILFQRDFPQDLKLYRQVIKQAELLKKPVIYDMDDYLLGLPENHPDRCSNIAGALLPMLEALIKANVVTVTTEKLRETLLEFNPNIIVMPNYLDDTIWKMQAPKLRSKEDQITIGYMGGDSHSPDLEWIAPVLLRIMDKYNDKIKYHFYGIKPPSIFDGKPNIQWTPIKTYNYKQFAKDFQSLKIDIFIAPLIDNLFNRCKSPIKYFEYTSLGTSGIFSDLEPYSTVIINGVNGLLADSLDEWYSQFVRLIEEPLFGYQLAIEAQKVVSQKWLMTQNANLWQETYQSIYYLSNNATQKKTVPLGVIESISDQLDKYHESLLLSLSGHQHDKDILTSKLFGFENEILYYALSKSWIYTRPFRKLMNLLKGRKNDYLF